MEKVQPQSQGLKTSQEEAEDWYNEGTEEATCYSAASVVTDPRTVQLLGPRMTIKDSNGQSKQNHWSSLTLSYAL